MLQAELKVIGGKQQGTKIPLPVGKFLIGREEDCHLRPNSELVSRHHCVFTADEYSLRIRDLGSTNGTLVNGERIRGMVVLSSGDKVTIGKLEVEVVLTDADAPAADVSQVSDGFNHAEAVSGDTSTTLSAGLETQTELPVVAPAAEAPLNVGDTVYPQQPMMQPAMGYPPQYMQMPYGYPPGYPQMQMPYYPQPMGYPQMPMPGYPQMPGYPPQPQQPQQPAAPQPPASNMPETRLPDPAETGAKAPEPPAAPAAGGENKPGGPTVRDSATDIIKQYLHRRPTSD